MAQWQSKRKLSCENSKQKHFRSHFKSRKFLWDFRKIFRSTIWKAEQQLKIIKNLFFSGCIISWFSFPEQTHTHTQIPNNFGGLGSVLLQFPELLTKLYWYIAGSYTGFTSYTTGPGQGVLACILDVNYVFSSIHWLVLRRASSQIITNYSGKLRERLEASVEFEALAWETNKETADVNHEMGLPYNNKEKWHALEIGKYTDWFQSSSFLLVLFGVWPLQHACPEVSLLDPISL